MKVQTLLYILFAVLVGIFAGYLLFNGTGEPVADAHDHAAEDSTAAGEETIWTCSMHPQIQRNESGDCPICGMDLIPLGSGNSTDPTVLTMTEAAVALARVRSTVIGQGNDETNSAGSNLRLTGSLASDDRTAAVQSVNYGGRLEGLLVTFPGEQVRAGQRIATIYSPDLVVAQEELLEARKLEALSPDLVVAARNKLRNYKLSDEQIAEVESTGEVVSNFPVYAERGGTVLDIRARVGDYVQAGAALYTLTNLDRLWALFDAYERNLSSIRVGDRVTFSVASLPDETFSARVTFIDPLINPATRTATIRAEVNNSRGRLKPEMFITGTINTTRKATVGNDEPLTVPKTAVLWTGNRSVVYVTVPDAAVPTYQFREITLGEPTGTNYRVVSGLEAGESVVTNGAFSIDAAAQLNNQLSMMNRDVVIQGREAAAVTTLVLPDYSSQTSADFREQLARVAEVYLPLKDKMVAGTLATEVTLTPIRAALSEVDMSLVKDDAHLYWMERLKALNTHLAGVAGAKDIAEQRKQFSFLSQALINTLTAFGTEGTLFVQHCPMAFDGEGANWLSESVAIRNPYFGDAMLTCGSTIDTLQITQ